jgi:hypothetical protein
MIQLDEQDAGMSPLRASVDSYLRALDSVFEEQGMPVSYRSFQGALGYAEDMVISVRGGSNEKPIGQAWFDAIHFDTHTGTSRATRCDARRLRRHGAGHCSGGGAPVSLSMPLTLTRPGAEQLTTKLCFPESLRDDEDPVSYIDGRIGIDTFPRETQRRLLDNISDIVRRTRRLSRGLRFAILPKAAQGFVDRVMWTLDHAVVSIAANSASRLSIALSELNLRRRARDQSLSDAKKRHGAGDPRCP